MPTTVLPGEQEHGRAERSRIAALRANPWVISIRPNQWSKAALVLAAPAAALRGSTSITLRLVAAFALACMAASGTYLLNDSVDADADRSHPLKRLRPIAAGSITRLEAVTVAVVLLTLAPTLGRFLNGATGLSLASYAAITVAYSTKLKQIPIVDIATIAAGFAARVMVGACATRTPVSLWFLTAVASGALMVAAGKRRGEVHDLGRDAGTFRTALKTYTDSVTSRLLMASACGLFTSLVAWATIGRGGPHLEETWATIILVPATIAIGRYLSIAFPGAAARPERLVRDRVLQIAGACTLILFVVGSLSS